jgi:hypothetical protein
MKKSVSISAQCYEFARHLFKTCKPNVLSLNRLNQTAMAQDLSAWKITAEEWRLAYDAAIDGYTSGRQDPDAFLRRAAGLDLANLPATPGMKAKREWV